MKKFIMAAAVAAMALSVGACSKGRDLDAAEKSKAEHGGLLYANSKGGHFESCSPRDSQKDGYVTCTGRLPQTTEAGGRALRETEFLCTYRGEPGCKPKPAK